MKLLRNDGQMLILTALFSMVMFGALALMIDVALLFRAKRNLQIAADASASAGALDYYFNVSSTSAASSARAAATANGVTDGVGGAAVSVYTPPVDGPNTGSTGYVEVVVSQKNPTLFMKLFGMSLVDVSARAVAGSPSPDSTCVYILDPSSSAAMNLQGSFDVSASHCGVMVDSNSSTALQLTGSGGYLKAGSVSVVGGVGGQTSDSSPAPVTGVPPVSDPLRVSGPQPPSGCSTVSSATSLTGDVSGPGTGSAICFTNSVNLDNVTLGSGIYVFENGVTTNGQVSSSSGGATLDIYGGSLSINTGTVFSLVAPTSGATNGIAIMEPASNSQTITIQKGDATGSLIGIIYAPSAALYLQDSGGGGGLSLTSDLVVDSLVDKTATLSVSSYSAAYSSTTPLRSVALVE